MCIYLSFNFSHMYGPFGWAMVSDIRYFRWSAGPYVELLYFWICNDKFPPFINNE